MNLSHPRYTAALLAVVALTVAAPSAGSTAPEWDDGLPMLLQSKQGLRYLKRGRELLLRFKIRESEAVFRALAGEPGGRPAALYYLSYASALKALIADRPYDHEEFEERTGALTEAVQGGSDSPWRLFIEAESQLLQAVVRAKQAKYLRAAFAGRRAYRGYERLVERYPGFHEAYKGLGLMHVAVGSLPGIYRTFLSVLGMHGSVEQGVRELRIAADSSLFAREEGGVLLSLFQILVDSQSDAGSRLADLHAQYPDSPLFGHLYGFYLYSERRAEEALGVLQQASEAARRPEYYELHFIDFYLADTLFRLGRYAEAVPYYQRYLDNQSGPALKALAALGIGQSLEMVGQRLAAESFYQDVVAAREFDSDRAARRLADRLLAGPMTSVDRKLLEAKNAFDSGRYSEAAVILKETLAENRLTPDERAEAEYRLARCDHVTGRLASALGRYRAAVAAGASSESRWAPWASYYIGRIEEDSGKDGAALQAYERALSFSSDYDYRQALEKNVKVALERLSQNRSR